MPKRILLGVALIAVSAGYYFVSGKRTVTGGRAEADLGRGSPAPNFSLLDLTGKKFDLSDYRGKVILLDFWATWCDACREEIPHFIQLQNTYRNQGLQIIGVSMDDGPEPVRAFYERYRMNYPVIMGDASMGELYGGVLGLPIAFLIGRDGRIARKYIGATNMSVVERGVVDLLPSKAGWQQERH